VSRVEIAPEVGGDFDRVLDHLVRHEVGEAPARILEIMQAFDVLERNPQIGRPAMGNMRELIIGHGSRGYLALYRYVPEIDTVFILALRSQRESGYKGR
jgi:plasmid stabilization system protein ParE